MPILCYSTTIDPAKSVAEIQRRLTRYGARAVMVENRDRRPVSVSFLVDTAFGERPYRLPANVDGVLAALERERRNGRVSRSQAAAEHAERVAWRIVLEWLKVQLAVIESGLVTLDQVMLPYMQVGPAGETVYQAIRDARLALPSPAAPLP